MIRRENNLDSLGLIFCKKSAMDRFGVLWIVDGNSVDDSVFGKEKKKRKCEP